MDLYKIKADNFQLTLGIWMPKFSGKLGKSQPKTAVAKVAAMVIFSLVEENS